MKIVIINDQFNNKDGGAVLVAFNLAKGFVKKGHKVFVITTTQDKKKEEIDKDFEDIKVYRLYVPYYHERWKSYLSLYNPKAVRKFKKVVRNIKPDIVHAHNIHYYLSYACLKIAKKYSKAVFLTAHDAMLFNYGKLFEFINFNDLSIPKTFNYRITFWQQIKAYSKRYNPLRNIIIRHYLKYVDKIFAVSYVLKDALNQNNIKNVEVIYNGIDVKNWQTEEKNIKKFQYKHNLKNKKVILFGGRLSIFKGGNKIIKAMELVSKEISDVVLLVLGEKNAYAQTMQKLAKGKNVNLILVGWIKDNELKSAYFCSDIVTTPSLCLDTFNLINIEAMACKKPVVGTCFGGTPEIVINNKTGYIVNPLNIQMMAEKIIDLLKNPDKAEQFGKIGYNRVKQKFGLEKQINETLEWYKKNI